jgi:hypothetical protein
VSKFNPQFDADADFAEVERLLRSARGYLQPTEDLRPNTLEASRDACRQRHSTQRLGTLAACALFLAATGFPEAYISSSLGPAFIQSAELQRRVAACASSTADGMNWALYEVISDIRHDQATRLKSAD